MSTDRNGYTIAGYDLTKLRDDILTEEIAESEEYENQNCYKRAGNIQIFDDPMCGKFLYIGYIISANDDYDDNVGMCGIDIILEQKQFVDEKLHSIFPNISDNLEYKVIGFNEWT